jgi:hypothetical protein
MFFLNVHNPNRFALQVMAAIARGSLLHLRFGFLNGFEGVADQIFQAMITHKIRNVFYKKKSLLYVQSIM